MKRLLLPCVVAALMAACSAQNLRGNSSPSPDGGTYLVVDDDNGGACGPISVDGKQWPHPLHVAGVIEPGAHSIGCGSQIEFEIKAAQTFHFNYWGP